MLNRKNRKIKTKGNFSYFIRYFGTFTIIFAAMTLIILQITRSSMYQSVDDNLRMASDNPEWVLQYSLVKSYYGKDSLIIATPSKDSDTTTQDSSTVDAATKKGKFPTPPSEKLNLGANTEIILFDEDGNAINLENNVQGLEQIPFKKRYINRIMSYQTTNASNHTENYRGMLIKVDPGDQYPTIKYAAILTSVNQLEQNSQDNQRVILMVMVSFWIISIVASQYLSKLSRKPLLESIERQKSFVENASHELRTPLAVLQNRLETLFRKPSATIMESSESIASSLEEVRNMRLLTTNLLNLARRDDGLKPEWTELDSKFFDPVFQNYSIIAEENGKEFTWNNQLTKPIKTDKTLLRQLMTILFDNAVKYTEDDGQIHFDVFVTKKDKQLVLRVKDNGPGINDSDKQRIFERFYRVDKARTRQKGGFGLGLSLAVQIVHALKGEIIVKDNKPHGAIFEVRLNQH